MPKLSVVVCTYNREVYIGKCLEHLAQQTAATADYQVVVVNNNSTDNTESVCQKVIAVHPEIAWTYVVETKPGLSHARNRGFEEANGDYIAFIDDDAFAHPNFAEELIAFFDRTPDAAAIGGKIVPSYEEGEPAWMSKHLLPLVASLDRGPQVNRFMGTKFPIGANMAFRTKQLANIGEFDPNLGRKAGNLEAGEEKDIFNRLKAQNATIYYVPTVVVDHIIPAKRVQLSYIKAMAHGVAISERKRLQGMGMGAWLSKWWSEAIKSAGTLVLALGHLVRGNPAKSFMLIRFRYWVISKLLQSRHNS